MLFIFILGIIGIPAQAMISKAIFCLPTKNYQLLSYKKIYSKDTIIKRDFDKDGIVEKVIIGRLYPNGFRIEGIQNQNGYELAIELSDCIDEFGDLLECFYVQISYVDLDNDGKEELIVSVGDMLVVSQTAIYKIRKSDTLPFIKVGQIEGQGHIYLTSENEIIAPIGSLGLYKGYTMQDGRLKITNGF